MYLQCPRRARTETVLCVKLPSLLREAGKALWIWQGLCYNKADEAAKGRKRPDREEAE